MITSIRRKLAVITTACCTLAACAEGLLPDFAINQITLDPVPTVTGATFTATVTIQNVGDAPGAPGTLRVWLNKGTWATTNETGDIELVLEDALDPQETKVVSLDALTAPATAGAHHFRAFVNADGLSAESPVTANNQLVEPYFLGDGSSGGSDYTPTPDFAILSVLLDPVPSEPGQTFQASVVVTNSGQVAGAPGKLRVWASYADVPEIGTPGDDEVEMTDDLDAGASVTVVFSSLTAPEAAGYYHFYAYVDADDETAEASEYNWNSQGYAITDPASGDPGSGGDAWKKPDFAFASISLSPIPTTREEPFAATLTVTNSGSLAGDAGILRIWVSRATAAGAGEAAEATADHEIGVLEPGASVAIAFPGLLSPALSGTHHFRAMIDADGVTGEVSEYNNQISLAYTLPGDVVDPGDPGTGWEKADFSVTGIVLDPTPTTTGQLFNASVTVKNTGSATGDAGLLRVWASRATAAAPETAGDAEVAVGELVPDQTATFTFNDLVAPAEYGTFHFRAFADADDETEEISEYNNHLSSVYAFAGEAGTPEGVDALPNYAVTDIVLTPVPSTANESFDVEVTLTNSGSADGAGVWLHLFESRPVWAMPGDADDAEHKVWIEGPIAVDDEIVRTFTLQAQESGTHHVRAYVLGTDTEWSLGDNQMTRAYSIGTPSWPGSGDPLPDFAVAEMAFIGPPPTISGDDYHVRVTVENRGGVSGDAGILYLFTSKSTFALPEDADDPSAAVAIGVLDTEGAGQTKTFDVKLNAPVERGTHHVRAYVLSPEEENSLGDNQRTLTYSISEIAVQIVVDGDEVQLTWNNYWGESYRIYHSSNIADPEGWTLLEGGIPSARPVGTNTFVDTPETAGFYRVAVEGPTP